MCICISGLGLPERDQGFYAMGIRLCAIAQGILTSTNILPIITQVQNKLVITSCRWHCSTTNITWPMAFYCWKMKVFSPLSASCITVIISRDLDTLKTQLTGNGDINASLWKKKPGSDRHKARGCLTMPMEWIWPFSLICNTSTKVFLIKC